MKHKVFSIIILLSLLNTGIAAARPSVFPTGVTIYKPSRAYNSFVVYGAPNGKSYMIDMDGNEVKTWPYVGFPTLYIDPHIDGQAPGRVLVHMDGFFNDKTVAEVGWDDQTIWTWGKEAPGGAALQNHDWARLSNGNTLILSTLRHVIPALSREPIDDQVIYEVNPQGVIVWKWVVSAHIDEFGISPQGMKILKSILAHGFTGLGFLTVNDMKPLGPNKWFQAGDSRFNPNNIIIDSREASFIAIIDKASGKITWRLGPDYRTVWEKAVGPSFGAELRIEPVFSDKLPRDMDQTSGQHDAYMIPEGLPGAGNILLFDNEGPSGFPSIRLNHHIGSRVLEINPQTKKIVWGYTADDSNQPDWEFYSAFISSARRLPNGNTLIDEGMYGRFFQVTPSGEIVWEYVNPHFGPAYGVINLKAQSNWVYRAQPVPYDWAPAGVPHLEKPVTPPAESAFHISPDN